MCENCELRRKKVKDGYLCKVLVGIHGRNHACPPSLVRVMAEV